MDAFGPCQQAFDVFESPGRMRAGFALRIKQRRLGKRQRHGAVNQSPFGRQSAAIARRGLHKAGFHLNRHHTHLGLNAARGGGQRHIHQRHDGPAVRDGKRVQMLGPRGVGDSGLAVIELFQLETEVRDEWDVNHKVNRHPLAARNDGNTTINGQILARDVLARIGRVQHA